MANSIDPVDLEASPPPAAWGVTIVAPAIDGLAEQWRDHRFDQPTFDYQGLPRVTGDDWATFCVLSVSVLACLWAPEGEETWGVRLGSRWLEDAPGLFACFARAGPQAFDPGWFAGWDRARPREFFRGRGLLQLVPERGARLAAVGAALESRWAGRGSALVEEAGWDARTASRLLVETIPGYRDRPHSEVGVLPFDKLANLCVAMIGSRSSRPLHGLSTLPVFPDYMLPRVLRHAGILSYSDDLAAAVDGRALIPEHSPHELAIRWATVNAAARLRGALHDLGNPVTGPQLDYRLWWSAVLGPDAGGMGEHHRTVTLAY